MNDVQRDMPAYLTFCILHFQFSIFNFQFIAWYNPNTLTIRISRKHTTMTLGWGEILIVLLVVGFIVALSFRAGIIRGRQTKRPPKE
jgi:protein-S-isoprenylcysteine O-methyltransferase Ste14